MLTIPTKIVVKVKPMHWWLGEGLTCRRKEQECPGQRHRAGVAPRAPQLSRAANVRSSKIGVSNSEGDRGNTSVLRHTATIAMSNRRVGHASQECFEGIVGEALGALGRKHAAQFDRCYPFAQRV